MNRVLVIGSVAAIICCTSVKGTPLNPMGAGPSPAFVEWAKAHGQSPQSAGRDAMYLLPGRLTLLASTGDQRAIPLLRRGLSSPNHMIEIAAANGLAELQDKESIPLIIEACKRAPEAAGVIAQSLVYFDDAEAQAAVDTYVPKDTAKGLREGKAQGKKTPLN
jgi:PBS lyase HEAT-like repeat